MGPRLGIHAGFYGRPRDRAPAREDAFEGSEQSLPFSIATRAVTKDFANCMNLAVREQVAQSFLTFGTSLDFSYRQGSDRDGDRLRSHI